MQKRNQKKTSNLKKFPEVAKQLRSHLKSAKAKYDALDPVAKKKLIAGIAGITTLLVGAHTANKSLKKRRDKRSK